MKFQFLFWRCTGTKAKNMLNLFDCTQGTSDLLHSTAIEGTLGSFGHDNSSVQHVSNVSTKDIHKSSDPHRHHQRQDRPNPKNGLVVISPTSAIDWSFWFPWANAGEVSCDSEHDVKSTRPKTRKKHSWSVDSDFMKTSPISLIDRSTHPRLPSCSQNFWEHQPVPDCNRTRLLP